VGAEGMGGVMAVGRKAISRYTTPMRWRWVLMVMWGMMVGPAGATPWTLDRCIHTAIQFNQLHEFAQADLAIEMANRAITMAATMPQLPVSGSLRESTLASDPVLAASIAIQFPLFVSDIQQAQFRSSDQKMARIRQVLALGKWVIIQQVIQWVYQWHRADVGQTSLVDTMGVVTQRIRQVQQWVAIGRSKPSELSALQAQLATLKAQYQAYSVTKKTIEGELSALVGQPVSHVSRWTPAPLPPDGLHPQVRALDHWLDSVNADRALAQWTSRPSLTAKAGGDYTHAGTGDMGKVSAQLSMTWPALDGGVQDAMQKKTTHQWQRIERERQMVATQIELKRQLLTQEWALAQTVVVERQRAYQAAQRYDQLTRQEADRQLATPVDVLLALGTQLTALTDWRYAQVESERLAALRYLYTIPTAWLGDPE